MLRGSSDIAREVYRGLYATGERFTITRLDVQVTGKFDFDNAGYAKEAEAQALAALVREEKVGRRKVGSIRNNGSGDTCAIGSRSSQRYLRSYDKTREQRHQVDENLWRWEVEYKYPLSTRIAEAIATLDEREPAIVALVADEFARKGVNVPWESDVGIEIPTTGVSATDDGRRLAWLFNQVRPVIGKLRPNVGLRAILVALGLEDLIPPEC
jgi:DNA relaxase NicK